jgi:hypothetical protein
MLSGAGLRLPYNPKKRASMSKNRNNVRAGEKPSAPEGLKLPSPVRIPPAVVRVEVADVTTPLPPEAAAILPEATQAVYAAQTKETRRAADRASKLSSGNYLPLNFRIHTDDTIFTEEVIYDHRYNQPSDLAGQRANRDFFVEEDGKGFVIPAHAINKVEFS